MRTFGDGGTQHSLMNRENRMYRSGSSFNPLTKNRTCILLIILLTGAALITPVAAATGQEAYLGNTVVLSGYAYGSDTVYLFLTGPNLPANGVALDNVNRPTDQGGFTVVDVNPDGSWSYRWYTGGINGKLDAGAYTVWVTDRPAGLSNLGNAGYSTRSIMLQQPGISVETTPQRGALSVNSTPSGASLNLNGKYQGSTPITIPDLPPDLYGISLSDPGFINLSRRVEVLSGTVTEVSVNLSSVNGTLWVTSVPVGADITIDGADAGKTPVLLANLTPGNHTITASGPGFSPVQETVRVVSGITIPVSVPLSKENPPSSTKPIVFAGVVPATVIACLVVVILAGFRKW